MRTRTRENVSYLASSYSGNEHTAACGNNSVSEGLSFDYWTGSYESMTDTIIPDFQKRVAKGEVFFNTMSKTKERRDVSLGGLAYHLTKKGSEACNYGKTFGVSPYCLNGLGSPVTHLNVKNVDVGRLIKLSGTKAYADVDSATFGGAVFIGELRETIGMLKRPLSNWNSFLRKVKKTKRGDKVWAARSVGSFISGHWLQYRYGIRPLQRDVQDAIAAIEKTVYGHMPVRKTARGYAEDSGEYTHSGNGGNGVAFSTTTSHEVSVRSMILYQMNRSADTFGVGLAQLPITIWELGTFTMVVDWFANVGDYIQAVTPKVGITKLGACTTVRTRLETSRDSYWKDGGNLAGRPRIIDNSCSTNELLVSENTHRSPGATIGLVSKVAPLGGDVGTARIVDLLAISDQLLKSK